MKLASLALLCVAALHAEELWSNVSTSNGISAELKTRLEPGDPPISKHGGGTLTEKNVIKRHLCNFENNTYFGYDLTMERVGEGKVRLHFAPLSMPPQQMSKLFKEVKKWKPLKRPRNAPASLDVRVGETVALDLFVNPSTGQKVTEYVTVRDQAAN